MPVVPALHQATLSFHPPRYWQSVNILKEDRLNVKVLNRTKRRVLQGGVCELKERRNILRALARMELVALRG